MKKRILTAFLLLLAVTLSAQNKKLFIHHDLRPFKELNEVWKLDKEISSHIPWIVSMTR